MGYYTRRRASRQIKLEKFNGYAGTARYPARGI